MSNVKVLSQLRKQMEDLKTEYAALAEAYRLLSQAQTGRGRKPSLDFLTAAIDTSTGLLRRRTGKRGRPPGAKNKPGYKKPGPKPKAATVPAKAAGKKR